MDLSDSDARGLKLRLIYRDELEKLKRGYS